ncbi:MAG: hypothetical protein ACXW6K_20455, partial [Candidatus Binatia bacterium]
PSPSSSPVPSSPRSQPESQGREQLPLAGYEDVKRRRTACRRSGDAWKDGRRAERPSRLAVRPPRKRRASGLDRREHGGTFERKGRPRRGFGFMYHRITAYSVIMSHLKKKLFTYCKKTFTPSYQTTDIFTFVVILVLITVAFLSINTLQKQSTNPEIYAQALSNTGEPQTGTLAANVPIVNDPNASITTDFPVGITVVANGRIEIGGVPYFPNGYFYVSWGHSISKMVATLQLIANAGFNTVHASANNLNEFKTFLDEAARLKVKVIEEGLDTNGIAAVKDYPALLGHNIGDDVHTNMTPQQLASKNAAHKAANPNHITYWSDYGGSAEQGPYIGKGDVVGPYDYPINRNGSLEDVYYYVNQIGKIAPIIFGVPQSFNWNDSNGNRPPTAQEYRNMLYQNFIENAKGTLSYDIGDNGGSVTIDEKYPDLWKEALATAAEVKQLSPVFLGGTYTKLPANNGVLCSYWQYQSKIYVIGVNPQSTSRTVSFTIPGSGSAQSMFSGRPSGLTFANGRLAGTINAQDVHVYIINFGLLE